MEMCQVPSSDLGSVRKILEKMASQLKEKSERFMLEDVVQVQNKVIDEIKVILHKSSASCDASNFEKVSNQAPLFVFRNKSKTVFFSSSLQVPRNALQKSQINRSLNRSMLCGAWNLQNEEGMGFFRAGCLGSFV